MVQNNCIEELVKFASATIEEGSFKPSARYHQDMDFVIYLNKDCSYRADRVDSFLTVLWHPQNDEMVGVKIKGFKFIFTQLKKILDLKEGDFVPLVKAVELALVAGAGESLMEHAGQEISRKRYQQAIELTKDVSLKADESLYDMAA